MATSSRVPPIHDSPRSSRQFQQEPSRLRRPASLSSGVAPTPLSNPLSQSAHIRKHSRGHSLGFVSSPSTAYMQQGPFPPYHALPREYRMSMAGPPFGMAGAALHRGYTKPSRPAATAGRHGDKSTKQKVRLQEEKQKSKGEKDKANIEHSFITSSSEIANMQSDLTRLQEDFNSGKLQAFDQQCSFEKMDNIRDLQKKLARLHFRMDEKLQAEGLHPTETIEVANENMDHLLSNLDQLRIAIGSLHPPRDDSFQQQDLRM